MSQRLLHRPARLPLPEPDLRPIQVVAPPVVPEAGNGVGGAMQVLLPILGGGGSLVMIVANDNPIMLVAGGIMLTATIAGGLVMFVAQRTGGAKRFQLSRRRYLRYLETVRQQLREAAAHQRAALALRHPAPAALPEVVRDPARLWDRRPRDDDFLVLRIGTGRSVLWRDVQVAAAGNPLVETDPVTTAAAARVVERDRTLEGVPVAVPLDGAVSVVGADADALPVVRAMIAQLAVLHAPDDVGLAVCLGPSDVAEFGWLKWLPHVLDPTGFDGPAPRRLIARDAAEYADLLAGEFARRAAAHALQRRSGVLRPGWVGRRLVVVVDRATTGGIDPLAGLPEGVAPAELGVVVVSVVAQRELEPSHVDVRVRCVAGQVTVEDLRPVGDHAPELVRQRRAMLAGAPEGVADQVSRPEVESLARQLAGIRLVPESAADAPLEATTSIETMLGIEDVGSYDVEALWAPRDMSDLFRVPFGLDPAGGRVFLDIKEPALGGMGPHGLCVGATGSGKSEALRTLVLAMAMLHPPERCSLVLVDYKGGATFAGLEDLPHTSAMISNLSDDTGLVDRLHDAVLGEMDRRQAVLRDAGDLPNITEYNRRRDAGQPLEPLPNLFVVIDEFGELLTAKPDFIELFLRIGRIGRSIGVHLLLASQRLEEGRLRGLESFLSYRLGLRTFNAQESRAVLGVPDAYELPPLAGSGYLKVDTTLFQRFKAAYVSGVYRPTAGAPISDDGPPIAPFPLFNDTAAWLAAAAPERPVTETAEQDVLAPSTLDVAVRRIAEVGTPAHRIWLPPLPAALPLDAVLGELVVDPGAGLVPADPAARGGLRFPLGLLDRPAEQRQETLQLDLAGGGGHVCVMGAPQSGKTVLLRSLIAGAALTHTPADVAFYCLDLGGGGLGALAGLPHVGGVAGRLDADRVRRTVAEVAAQLVEREQLFAGSGIDSVESMRELHRAGRIPELAAADVFLVIDNYPVLKSDFEDLADVVQDIGARGLGYGVHLVLTTGRWADLRLQLQAVIGTKVELRINDPLDSTVARKAAENLRADTPGRCLVLDGLTAHVALPRIDGRADPTTVQSGLAELIDRVAAAWPGEPVPPIRMLPTHVRLDELTGPRGDGVLIGVDEAELRPVELDLLGSEPHLLVYGDAESGKTSLLRLIVHDLVSRYTDDQVVFAVFDVRRTLLDVVPEDHLGAYAGTPAQIAGMAQGVAAELAKRLPPDDVTAAQLRSRSWWSGPEIVVLCDDFDLVSPSGPGPLAPFLEYLPQSRDLGLHLVVARRSGGAGRAAHEPVPQRLRELGATGLLLSGDRSEGQLWPGATMSSLPPGRGRLIRRGRKPVLVQLALPPEDAEVG